MESTVARASGDGGCLSLGGLCLPLLYVIFVCQHTSYIRKPQGRIGKASVWDANKPSIHLSGSSNGQTSCVTIAREPGTSLCLIC